MLLLPEVSADGALARELAARGARAIVAPPPRLTADAADVVLIDIGAERDPVHAAGAYVAAMPGLPFVLLADAPDDDVIIRAVLAGAAGVLPRDLPAEALARAALGVAAGEAAVPRSVGPKLLREVRRDGRASGAAPIRQLPPAGPLDARAS